MTINKTLSRYSILLSYDGIYLIYNSRTNNFYRISQELYYNLENKKTNNIDSDTLSVLEKSKIIASQEADNEFLDSLVLRNYIISYSPSNVQITLAPTISCNLRCHYCFEKNKPTGTMPIEICDKFIDFLKSHQQAKTYSLTWFGGEPLIAIDKIEYILNKLKDITDIKRVGHNIITNATLLNKRAINVFKEYPLDSLQVTLDGIKDTHDKRRIHPDGNGTFDCIIANISNFMNECPDTVVNFRINIDKNNAPEFAEIKQFIDETFKGKKVNVSPGYLQGDCDCEPDNSFLTSKDVLELHKLLNNKGISLRSYPFHCNKGCTATNISSYVIGPMGEIYKCWEHIGVTDKICGNISDKTYSNEKIIRQFMLYGTCLNNESCRLCPLIPICSGGCPKRRIENTLYGKKHELCNFYRANDNEGLKYLLYEFYKKQNFGTK